jgi:putative inorganic carbon (HCO3(-)) transporter
VSGRGSESILVAFRGETDAWRTASIATASCIILILTATLSATQITALAALASVMILATVSPLGVLCAALATLPWFYHPIGIGSSAFPASELLTLAAAIGLAARTVFVAVKNRSAGVCVTATVRLTRLPLVLTLVVLTVTGGILAIWPYDPMHRAESLREWRWVLLEPMLLVGVLTVVARHAHARTAAALAMLVGASAAAIYGVGDVLRDSGVAAGGVTRITGPYPHPNAFALLAARAAVFAAAWAILSPSLRRSLFPPALLLAAVSLATFSRGAFLSLTAGLLMVLPAVPRRFQVLLVGLPSIIAVLGVLSARDRVLDFFGGGSGSLRLDIWTSALHMIADRPLRGYGPDQFLYAYLPRYIAPTAWQERFTAHAHNLFLDFWIRLGIIGCTFIVCAVAVCLLALGGVLRRPQSHDALTAAAIVALSASIVHGLVDNAYFAHDLAMSAWLLAWLAFGSRLRGAAKGAADGARPRFRWRRVHWVSPVRQSTGRRA